MGNDNKITPRMSFHHTLETQKTFAELSGDFNPVHLDPVQARRTLFGDVVAHGVHNVLRALELSLLNRPDVESGSLQIERLAVIFKNPVFMNETISVFENDIMPGATRLELKCGDTDIAEIRMTVQPGAPLAVQLRLTAPKFNHQADEKTFAELENAEGEIDLAATESAIIDAFPQCARALGPDGVARLLGLTRLVGMRCPGLHSLFSGFDVRFTPERSAQPTRYRVLRTDDRISLLTVSVEGGGMAGTVNAFMRPAPVRQPDMATVGRQVSGTPFLGVRALVIGGSRGLGEISAKIIACGGGDVVVTYLNGKEDANRVALEISEASASCRALQLDVANPVSAFDALGELGWLPTHLFYFATPRISSRKSGTTDDVFRQVYSTGQRNVLKAVRNLSTGPLTLFYPSSIYVEECPADLASYATAKEEGETVARGWAENDPDLTAIIERLPALATDQTASLLDVAVKEPLDFMARLLKEKL